ncbi:oligosaccharide flippase family protein [Deinococcus daejeonensis]|uniref:oligosaccharide flippase family protein n=1 Tax=Deinococcus daejeonensis TaxID=1007098 RepID=UPI0016648F68|nr:oligosaccharide flippase family protein [Deinococcus daejeonensis]
MTEGVWSDLLFLQTFALWISLLMEFGFSISAVREVAGSSMQFVALKSIVSNVFSAKILLIPIMIIVSSSVLISGYAAGRFDIVGWAVLIALLQGFTLTWLFQGLEKLYIFSIVDIFGRLAYILLSLAIAKYNNFNLLALCFSLAYIFPFVFSSFYFAKYIDMSSISLKLGAATLKLNISIAKYTLITSVYSAGSTVIFGFFGVPSQVGLYAGADRVARAGISLMGPMNQILLPRSIRAYSISNKNGIESALLMMRLYLLFSLFIGGTLFIFSEQILNFILGESFRESVSTFRILCLLFPVVAINTVLTYHILIPMKRDKIMNDIYLLASLFAFTAIIVLGIFYGKNGVALGVVIPEFCILAALYLQVSKIIRQGDGK